MIRHAVWLSNRYWRCFESYERCGVPRVARMWLALAAIALLALSLSMALFYHGLLFVFLLSLFTVATGVGWGLARRHRNRLACQRVSRICGVTCKTVAQAKRAMLQRYLRRYRIEKVRDTIKYVEETLDKCMERREFDQANHLFFQVLSLRWLSKLGSSPWWLITALAGVTFFAADKAFDLSSQWLQMTKSRPLLLALLPLLVVLLLVLIGQVVAMAGVVYTKLNERRGLATNRYSRQRLHYLLGDVVYFVAYK